MWFTRTCDKVILNAINQSLWLQIRATAGKKQAIIAGTTTDVSILILLLCMRCSQDPCFPGVHCLSRAFIHRRRIYRLCQVANADSDASGALSECIASANDRMRAAGVHVLSLFTAVCDLMRDWRNTPDSLKLFKLPYFDKWAITKLEVIFVIDPLSLLQGISLPLYHLDCSEQELQNQNIQKRLQKWRYRKKCPLHDKKNKIWEYKRNHCRLTWHCQTLTQILAATEHRCDITW